MLYINQVMCNSIGMAGLTLAQRDLAETREQLHSWVGSHLSMFKMACRILRTKVLLRGLGLTDHGFLRAPILPSWAVETIH